jgi:SET domain-containing protein 6
MKSIAPIAKGDEIFNDYGPLPRSDLLRRYGYITDNYAQYDVVEISLDLVTTVAKEELGLDEHNISKRLAYLDEIDVLEDDSFDISSGEGLDRFPEVLMALLCVLAMSSDTFSTIRLDPKGAKKLFKMIEKNDLPPDWSRLLSSVLTRRSADYETNVQDDQESLTRMLQDTQNNSGLDKGTKRKTMALQVRIGEKNILAETLLALQDIDGQSQKARENTETKKRAADEEDDVEMGGTNAPSSAKRRK